MNGAEYNASTGVLDPTDKGLVSWQELVVASIDSPTTRTIVAATRVSGELKSIRLEL